MARHQLAVLSLAAIAIVSSFWFLLDILGTASRNAQALGVAGFENRFNGFRKTVKPHAVYGYISDSPRNDPSARSEFALTQYTLAPAIIKPSANEPLVIVNYHNRQPDPKLLQVNRLVAIRDFGNGVLLCGRTLR